MTKHDAKRPAYGKQKLHDGSYITDETCECGHSRDDHVDRYVAYGHGYCNVDADCDCGKYTWHHFVTDKTEAKATIARMMRSDEEALAACRQRTDGKHVNFKSWQMEGEEAMAERIHYSVKGVMRRIRRLQGSGKVGRGECGEGYIVSVEQVPHSWEQGAL